MKQMSVLTVKMVKEVVEMQPYALLEPGRDIGTEFRKFDGYGDFETFVADEGLEDRESGFRNMVYEAWQMSKVPADLPNKITGRTDENVVSRLKSRQFSFTETKTAVL